MSRYDPLEVFCSALTSLPLRFLFAWLVAAVSHFLPYLIKYGVDSLNFLVPAFFMCPLFLFINAFGYDSYLLLFSIPAFGLLVLHWFKFILEEGDNGRLYVIASLSFVLAMLRFVRDSEFLLMIPVVIVLGIQALRFRKTPSAAD